MMDIITPHLPLIFICLTGLSLLIYSVLDGYDLGIGILLSREEAHRDTMIAAIGPFWDANETWLVLAVGLILIAFPSAHSIILTELYIPVTIMLLGLILRGVSFDFRAKAAVDHKDGWDIAFRIGSILATLSQGYMLGQYVLGFEDSVPAILFSCLSAVCISAGYCLLGAGWLLIKTEGEVQLYAARWGRYSAWLLAIGILAVSVTNPLVSEQIYQRWFSFPEIILLIPIPLMSFLLLFMTERYLYKFTQGYYQDYYWLPFIATTVVFFLCFQALAYSFYPYIIQGKLTIWEAASASSSLQFIFVGTVIVLPAILAYTVFVYRVFSGKATELRYD